MSESRTYADAEVLGRVFDDVGATVHATDETRCTGTALLRGPQGAVPTVSQFLL